MAGQLCAFLQDNMCLVAQTNIFFGWGRISLTEEMPSLPVQGTGVAAV